MKFNEAVEAVKNGKMVGRTGWTIQDKHIVCSNGPFRMLLFVGLEEWRTDKSVAECDMAADDWYAVDPDDVLGDSSS